MGIPVYWSLPARVNPPATLKPALKRTRPLPSSIRRQQYHLARHPRLPYSEVVRRHAPNSASASLARPDITSTSPQSTRNLLEQSLLLPEFDEHALSPPIINPAPSLPNNTRPIPIEAPPYIARTNSHEADTARHSNRIRGLPRPMPEPDATTTEEDLDSPEIGWPWQSSWERQLAERTAIHSQSRRPLYSPEPIASESSSESTTYEGTMHIRSPSPPFVMIPSTDGVTDEEDDDVVDGIGEPHHGNVGDVRLGGYHALDPIPPYMEGDLDEWWNTVL